MRLVRLGPAGSETPGVLVDDDTFVDLSDVVGDFDEKFFGSGALATLGEVVAERVAAGRTEPVGDRRFGAPFARPHQILCIGLNYSDHAAETGQAVPSEPILFTKSPNTLIGPNDDVLIPRGSRKTDWEVELGIVIGRHASYLADETEAAASIAGYVLVNDVSEREWQIERNGQWSKGKSAPTFNPAGPYLVTPDEVGDVLALDMRLEIDGTVRQNGSTSTMIFSPAFIVQPEPVPRARARRPHQHRHAARRRHGSVATGVPARRRDHDSQHHAARHADPARHPRFHRCLMRALVVTAPRQAAVLEVADPIPSAGELLVGVERVGICGTDVELYTGEMAYIDQGHTHFPIRLGHEWTGRVVAVGDSADDGWLGKRVTGDTMLGCGHCDYCLAGVHHVCPDRFEVGIRDGWAGALAEKTLVPTRFAYEIPEHVSVTAAALVEPGGNSLRAVRAANITPGDRVLVLGSGTIGLLAAQFALAASAEVHVGGVREGSLVLARSLGVQQTRRLADLADSPSDQFDAVIEATSNVRMPALSVRLAKPAGRVVFIGLSSTPSLVDTRDIALKDITAVGILSASPGLAGAIEHFADGSVVPHAIVSEVVSLEDVPSRLEGARGTDAGPGPKVHVDPRLRT